MVFAFFCCCYCGCYCKHRRYFQLSLSNRNMLQNGKNRLIEVKYGRMGKRERWWWLTLLLIQSSAFADRDAVSVAPQIKCARKTSNKPQNPLKAASHNFLWWCSTERKMTINAILCKPSKARHSERMKKKKRGMEKHAKMVPQCLRQRFVPAASFLHIDLLSSACVVFTFHIGTLKSIASLFHIKIIHVIVHFIIHKLNSATSNR